MANYAVKNQDKVCDVILDGGLGIKIIIIFLRDPSFLYPSE